MTHRNADDLGGVGALRARWSGRAVALARRHWLALIGVAAVVALVLAVNPREVAGALVDADRGPLILMLPCVALLYTAHGIAWWVALRGVGAPVRLREAVRVTWIAQAFVFLPGGDLWKVPVVAGEDGAALAHADVVASVVFDDLVYFFVLTAAMLPAVVARPGLTFALAIAVLPQTAIFTVLLWRGGYEWLVRRVVRLPWVDRFAPQLELLGPSFRRLCTRDTLVRVVAVDAVCAVLAILLFALSLASVHAHAPLADTAFAYATGNVASGLTMLPGALGAYEGMMTGLMAVQGVAPALAAAASLIYRACNDVLMALLGLGLALVATPGRRAPAFIRRLAGVPWRVFGLGRAGGGRAAGIPWFWSAWESLMLRTHPLTPMRPGSLFSYRLIAHRGADVTLADGTVVQTGDRLVEVHLDSRHFAAFRDESGYTTWGAVRAIRGDLAALAARVAVGELGPVVALTGVSLLGEAGERFGFEVRPLPHSVGLAFERYFLVGLDAIHHPAGLARLRGHSRERWPVATWMSVRTLEQRYGRRRG